MCAPENWNILFHDFRSDYLIIAGGLRSMFTEPLRLGKGSLQSAPCNVFPYPQQGLSLLPKTGNPRETLSEVGKLEGNCVAFVQLHTFT